MEFSVIVPTHNRRLLLEACLGSLMSQTIASSRYEVIVINDASTDGTGQMVQKLARKHENLRCFNVDFRSPGAARNAGLKKAKGRCIAFTDDDCIVQKDWLEKIQKAFAKTNADAVGGSILNPTNTYIAWSQYLLNFSAWMPRKESKQVKDMPTANICYKKSCIMDHFFVEWPATYVYEDSLFNWCLIKQNRRILFCPNINVSHYAWDGTADMKKFLAIQKKAALGFAAGGYVVHGFFGRQLFLYPYLNLLCPRLLMVFYRCLLQGKLLLFLWCLPLLILGELYKGIHIIREAGRRKKTSSLKMRKPRT